MGDVAIRDQRFDFAITISDSRFRLAIRDRRLARVTRVAVVIPEGGQDVHLQ
jgi:hypothetical protein